MKNDALNHFKEEMNKRGLFRKIQVCANLIPPPPGAVGDALIDLHRSAAKIAIWNYAEHHEDFCDVMADAALDHNFSISQVYKIHGKALISFSEKNPNLLLSLEHLLR